MNKKAQAKESQFYRAKPKFPMCSNCKHFEMDVIEKNSYGTIYNVESNLRCGLGGFAVKKQATCGEHSFMPEVATVTKV